MKKTILILTGFLLSVSAFCQITLGDDGLYYDKDQNPFTGQYKEYFDNGQAKQDMTLMNGKVDGLVSVWFRSGALRETRVFKSGKREGQWISYDEKGKKTGEASYKDDLKEGPWKIWDENGVLRYDMYYRKGQKSGLWIMYDASGNKTEEKRYPDEK